MKANKIPKRLVGLRRSQKIAYWRRKNPDDWFFRQTKQLTLLDFHDVKISSIGNPSDCPGSRISKGNAFVEEWM